MSLTCEDLFGDIDDIGGFSDDDENPRNNQRFNNKRKNFSFNENFQSNKKFRKDNWKSKPSSINDDMKNSKNTENVAKELYSGIRLTKPLVSSDELKKLMQGRRMIKLSKLKSFANNNNDDDSDWVTIGVVVNKSTKTSKNGKDYSIWNLSDLTSEKVVSFFLFGMTHERHWKLPTGSVIGLLNASFMDKNNSDYNNKKNKDQISPLTINDPDKLLHIGTSKDLGYCKAIKKNGDVCGSLIMKADEEFCLYHIKNAYRKFSSNRAEIQSTFSNKEPHQYHFANNFSPDSNPLSQSNVVLEMSTINKLQLKKKKETEAKNLEKVLANPLSRAAKNLAALSQKSPPKPTKIERPKPLPPTSSNSSVDNSPMLAKGYRKGEMIDLKVSSTDKTFDFNKQKAIELFRNRKSISSTSSTSKSTSSFSGILNSQQKVKNRKLQEILKKVDQNLNESSEELKKEQLEAEKEKQKILDEALKRKSINDRVVDLIENKAQEKHFDLLEKKEKYENSLADVKEIEVKVVTCKDCKYTAPTQSDYCKNQKNHQVIYHQAKKRFFSCRKCRYRKFTYDSPYPITECPNCGKASFEKASIINIRTETKLTKDLLIRGEEIKFLNSSR